MSKQFEDLEVWKKSRELAVLIYKITNEGKLKNDFGLKDQLRRASISIVSNISEGYERNINNELVRFLSIAKGSAGEIRAQLYIAKDLGYIEEAEFLTLKDKVTEVSKMLAGFMNYIVRSDYKGARYVKESGTEYFTALDAD